MTIVFSVHGWLFIRFQPGLFRNLIIMNGKPYVPGRKDVWRLSSNYKGKRIYNHEETGLIVFCGPPIGGLCGAPATINIGFGSGPWAIPCSFRAWSLTPFGRLLFRVVVYRT